MRLGIFGGTFDPPHLGHLILAAESLHQLELDSILWVLTPDPPHKQGQVISPLLYRQQLLEAALLDNPAFQLSKVDIERPAPHYALDTLRLLAEQFPEAQLIYLMGGDSLFDLPAWHAPQAFIAACDALGVMRRPGFDPDIERLEVDIPGVSRKLLWVDAPLVGISATDIRLRISQRRPYRYMLPDAVFRLVETLQLYRPGN